MKKPQNKKSTVRPELARLLILGAVVGITMLFIAVAYNASTPPPSTSGNMTVSSQLIREDSPTLGPADAKVTIVEFLDPECESCRAMFPVVKQLLQEYDGRVRLVVRYFPLHGNSVLAAAATEAAGEQGKYWEMQALLFEQQPTWGEKQTPQTELFLTYAQQLGLDLNEFSADLQKPEYAQKIQRDYQDALALKLRGTPTFFINGQPIQRLSYDALKAAIEAGLK